MKIKLIAFVPYKKGYGSSFKRPAERLLQKRSLPDYDRVLFQVKKKKQYATLSELVP